MNESKPARCRKCGKPVGYITVVTKGLTGLQQTIHDVKIIVVCIDCSQK